MLTGAQSAQCGGKGQRAAGRDAQARPHDGSGQLGVGLLGEELDPTTELGSLESQMTFSRLVTGLPAGINSLAGKRRPEPCRGPAARAPDRGWLLPSPAALHVHTWGPRVHL